MEPNSTFKEVHRILRPGGVFCAYDCDWPPTLKSYKAEMAYRKFTKQVKAKGKEMQLYKAVNKWKKEEHMERLQNTKLFTYVKEIVVHNIEEGNAERLVGLALSQGSTSTVLKNGIKKEDLGFLEFAKTAEEELGSAPSKFYWSYRIRIAVK